MPIRPSRQLLAAVEPAAVGASLAAIEDVGRERQRPEGLWQQRLERARYEADRAARPCHAAGPEDRLVARERERRGERPPRDQQRLEQQHEDFLKRQPGRLAARQSEDPLASSRGGPALRHAPPPTPADRRRVARSLLERVVVTAVGTGERVAVRPEWAGGDAQEHVITRPVGRHARRGDYPKPVARLRESHERRLTATAIAERLHQEGFRPPERAQHLQREMVCGLPVEPGLGRPRVPPADEQARLGADGGRLSDLSDPLGIPRETLHRWRRVGWIHGRELDEPRGRWVLRADAEELERLRRLRHCPRTWDDQPLREELTIPKDRGQ